VVNVSIEVRSGPARFDVGVQVESIQGAMSLVNKRYPEAQRSDAVPDSAHLARQQLLHNVQGSSSTQR
jgi:hypothetical protein